MLDVDVDLRTWWWDQIAPNLSQLIKYEEHAEEPYNERVRFTVFAIENCKRFGDDG